MSIKMIPGAARLTVLGSGWNNSSIESGSGLTEEGQLWEDIAGDLGYDFGNNVDWDTLVDDYDWSVDIYTDEDGNKYIPEAAMIDLAAFFEEIAGIDRVLMRYSVNSNDLKNLYGGMVSQEATWDEADTARPHMFYPDVYYIQISENSACLFQEEAFWHRTADGGSISVNDKSITIRTGSSMKVCWSTCSTRFDSNYLPSPYNTYPIEYVCWQCLWGSFKDMLISSNENTATAEQIQNGEIYKKTTIDGKPYYLIQKV